MVQKVIFTKTAERAFSDIANFLEENASIRMAQQFVNSVDEKIEKLKEHPYIGRPSMKARSAVLVKITF